MATLFAFKNEGETVYKGKRVNLFRMTVVTKEGKLDSAFFLMDSTRANLTEKTLERAVPLKDDKTKTWKDLPKDVADKIRSIG